MNLLMFIRWKDDKSDTFHAENLGDLLAKKGIVGGMTWIFVHMFLGQLITLPPASSGEESQENSPPNIQALQREDWSILKAIRPPEIPREAEKGAKGSTETWLPSGSSFKVFESKLTVCSCILGRTSLYRWCHIKFKREVIYSVNNIPSESHQRTKKILQRFSKLGLRTAIREDVKQYSENCLVYAQNNPATRKQCIP